MSSPASQAARELTTISHLPASMNGSPFLYATSLTAVMCGMVLGLYVMTWMGREMIRDRKHAGFKSVLFNFRAMMGLAGTAAFCACLPEVLYLQMYGDPQVSLETQGLITMFKRVMDSTRIFFIIGWVSLLVMIYPYVCLSLMEREDNGTITHIQVADYPGIERLVKPGVIFVILAVIAMAFAYAKVYGA